MRPLSRFRIVEIGVGPVSGIATTILADFGADVIKIMPPAGDPFEDMASWPMWNRGKRLIRANLSDEETVVRMLNMIIETADAVVTTLSPHQREALCLSQELLESQDLVIGIVSGFGEDGPYANYPGYEPVVAAKSGRMLTFEGVAEREGPNYSALQVGTHATAQAVAFAMLAALWGREETGIGFTFETSLLRGMQPYEMGIMAMAQLWDKGILERPKEQRDRTRSMPTFNYHPVRTKDGKWLQLGNLLPHLLDNFFEAAGLSDALKDTKYKGDPIRWPADVRESFRDLLFEHMQTRTLAEWTETFVGHGGVVSHPYQTTQEALRDPDLVDNGHVVTRDGITQLGLVANLTATPGEVGPPAREITFDELEKREPISADPQPTRRVPLGNGVNRHARPLNGLLVIESATIIAAPLGASVLADLGAKVFKIEPIGGDPFRNMFHGFGAAKCNADKLSICLDLKSAQGQEVAHRLAEQADIWIHNYRMGVPEKLGIGYEDLKAHNPKLVYVSVNGYGPNGPGAKRPSTHPIPGAALGGVTWQLGGLPPADVDQDNAALRETARKLLRANEVNPDPNTSMVVATAALLGLVGVRAHGKGQKIFVDMMGANAYANWDDFIDYEGKPERPKVDPQGYGIGPLQRLYRCKDGWVFLLIAKEREWARLVDVLELAIDHDDPTLEATLEGIFAAGSADDFEARLAPWGVGCVRADGPPPPDFFLNDEHCEIEEMRTQSLHPQWGQYWRNGPMARFDRGEHYRGAGEMGDWTDEILHDCHYNESEIEAMREAGVIYTAPPNLAKFFLTP